MLCKPHMDSVKAERACEDTAGTRLAWQKPSQGGFDESERAWGFCPMREEKTLRDFTQR